ncbi:sugar isomerase domain-containing protein [Actinoallomurus rhizosphaericola]|uniref:sugar isomerase domain-containing protein n=1 Tax=Actinoallomurus rhizosphaericola TaxID=2952536 RepID=UPI00209021FA|nr:sugar isomerase domain-containing protein [Actinoallomurus rhizosphaericola]MCO5993750.1 sugar isomerase domain-containing protein [Actinoallomurus rhizosphaericola]
MFVNWMLAHLERIERHNADELEHACRMLLDTVLGGGLVYLGGSGHSLAMVLEGFFRAGGLACVHPLSRPEISPLNGAWPATEAERRSGVAAPVLEAAAPRPGDLVMIFSNSGTNPYPVELAATARSYGLPVIAVVSGPSMAAAPTRAGVKLGEVADLVLDTLTPPGDASYPVDAPRTAALSSLSCVYLWNLLLARMSERAELPLWVSANVPGGDERNAELLARYSERVPVLRTSVMG